MIGDLKAALFWLVRGLKKGDWLWLWLAVLMASMTVTLVNQLSATVEQSLLRQASETLGADAVIKSTRPIDDVWRKQAESLGFKTSNSVSLVTMLYFETLDDFQMVRLIAVEDNAPLRGNETGDIPKPELDKLFLEGRLWQRYQQLASESGIEVKGAKLEIGARKFAIEGQYLPKALGGMNAIAPEVRIHLQDIDKTGLLLPTSRVTYQLSVSAETGQLKALQSWLVKLKAEKNANWQILSSEAPNQDLKQAMETAKLFLQLAALSAVLVAGLAVLIASRFYLGTWQNSIALMRAYGASQQKIRHIFAWQLTLLGVIASLLGATLGLALFHLSMPILENFFDVLVIDRSSQPFLLGLVSGALVLWGFAWQAYRQVVNIAPIQVLKEQREESVWQDWLGFGFLLFLVWLMVGWQNLIWVALGLMAVSLAFALMAWLILLLIRQAHTSSKGWLRLSFSALLRSPGLLQMQLISFGLVLFVLMLMTFVRQDLVQQWQSSFTEETPNTFIMNVQPDQKEQTESLLQQYDIQPNLIQMSRGRLIAKNGASLLAENQDNNRARRMLQREANIALMRELPSHNNILKSNGEALSGVSIEKGIAELFDIQVGDELTFDFVGLEVPVKVSSIREVEWQSFELNFFFILPKKFETQMPFSYMGNFHQNEQMTGLSLDLNRSVSGVLLVDVKNIIERVQSIMDQASLAVTALYAFTLISSLIVLLTATYATQQGRINNWILLRTLGASRQTMLKMGLAEFALMGLGAGLVAASFAQIASILLSIHLFKMPWEFQWQAWLVTMLVGSLVLLLIGWLTQAQFLKMDYARLNRFSR